MMSCTTTSSLSLSLQRFARGHARLLALGVALMFLTTGCASGCDDEQSPDAGQLAEDMSAERDLLEKSDMGEADDMPADSGRDPLDMDPSLPDASDMRVDADMRRVPIDLDSFDFGTPEDQGLDPLAILGVNPPRGPLEGATPFVIEGEGFTPNTRVLFGANEARVELVDGVLVGETPPGTGPGPVTVRLLDPDQGDEALVEGFTYTTTFALTSISPSRIPTQGLIEVDVTGAGFDAWTRVSFGGRTALRHTLVDPTLLRVIAPAHPVGAVDVRVTNQDDSRTLPQGGTYFLRPSVTSVTPTVGPLNGGEDVTIAGRGFVEGMQIFFDGRAVTPSRFALGAGQVDDLVNVTTPVATQPGLVDVSIVLPDGLAAIGQDLYLYTNDTALAVASLSPTVGPDAGGQQVTIIGPSVGDMGVDVLIGGAQARVVSRQDGSVIVETPASATLGAVDVQVGSVTLTGAYTYEASISITQVSPPTGDVTGGELVTLSGAGFSGVEDVEFGGLDVPAFTIVSDTEIEVTTPAHPTGVVDITLARGEIRATLDDAYAYTETTSLLGFSPVRGALAGGTYVVFRGTALERITEVRFGGVPATDVNVLDAQTLAVKTPPALMPGSVEVSLTTDEGVDLIAPQSYLYFNPGARFGGAWGGSIQGAVNVTVYSQGGGPIENAFVMLSSRPDTQYQGLTDANGMVTLSGPEVFGEQSITAVAAGHSSTTVQRVDAENITIFLSPPPNPGQPPAGAQPATFRGQLTGLNKLAEPGPSQFAMAFVYTTQVNPSSPNPDPGSRNTLLSDGEYSITTRLGDLALVAVGGLYDNATQTFEPLRMGVARYQFASEGMIYDNVDIDLSIVLDQTLSIKMNNTPSGVIGPNNKQVQTWMEFGFEGVFGSLPLARGTNADTVLQIEHLPELSGELAGVDLFLEAGTYTNGNTPFSIGLLRGITQLNRLINVDMLDVPRMTSPSEGARPLDGLITFDYASPFKPDIYYVRVQTFMQQTKWEGFLPGDATSLRLPTFPDFSNLPADQQPQPYTGEALMLVIYAIKQPGLDFNQFNYTDLNQDQWTAYSVSLHTIVL